MFSDICFDNLWFWSSLVTDQAGVCFLPGSLTQALLLPSLVISKPEGVFSFPGENHKHS